MFNLNQPLFYLFRLQLFSPENINMYAAYTNKEKVKKPNPVMLRTPNMKSRLEPLSIFFSSSKMKEQISDLKNIAPETKKSISRRNSLNKDLKSKIKTKDTNLSLPDVSVDRKLTPFYQGVIYKITQKNRMKPMMFKLVNNDYFYFEMRDLDTPVGMRNLSYAYCVEEEMLSRENKSYYCFSILFGTDKRFYYVENYAEFNRWLENLQQVTFPVEDINKMSIEEGVHRLEFSFSKMTSRKLLDVMKMIDFLDLYRHENVAKLRGYFRWEDKLYVQI